MGVQLFGGQFYKCVDIDGRKLSPSEVANRSMCEEMAESHNYSWINAKVHFDNVGIGYLALFQVVSLFNCI